MILRDPPKYLEPQYGPRNPLIPLPELYPVDPKNWDVSRNAHNQFSIQQSEMLLKESGCYDNVMQTTLETLTVTDNQIPILIYRKPGSSSKAIVLYFHGGSFCMNSAAVFDTASRTLVHEGGYTLVSVDYRLAPEHPFPEGLEDCYSVLEWVYEYADFCNGSANEIYVAGDSSGGCFAAVIAQMARDRNGPEIKGQILIYPVTVLQPEKKSLSELTYGKNHLLNYDSSQNPFPYYIQDDEQKYLPYVSPLYADSLADLPPALILLAGCDPLLDQGLQYAQALHEDGVSVKCHVFEGMMHGFITRSYPDTFDLAKRISNFVMGL